MINLGQAGRIRSIRQHSEPWKCGATDRTCDEAESLGERRSQNVITELIEREEFAGDELVGLSKDQAGHGYRARADRDPQEFPQVMKIC